MKKSINFITLAIFAPVLILAGVAGFIVPAQQSLTSGAAPYNVFHIFFGIVGLLLVIGRRETSISFFNLGFGLIDLYQALASFANLPPKQYFLWTRMDDVLHILIGLALVIIGGYGVIKRERRKEMSATARAMDESPNLDLAALRQMSFKELDALYRVGKRPAALSDLDGDAVGAMLAWRSPARGPVAWWLRTFGASTAFPWEGKSFKSQSNDQGEGINRVKLFGKRRWFPFKTRFGASFLDGSPTFILDYSGPANPPFIRSIADEVREVAPRLYLGPAALVVKGKPRPILFFAVSLQ